MKIFGIKMPSLGRFRMEGGNQNGRSADTYIEQLADHLARASFGDFDTRNLLGGNYRDRFIRFPGLARTVTLISGVTAQIICNGKMTVRNRDDELVNNRRTDRILELMTHSPDGGMTPAATFIEDLMSDYLLDGNALIHPYVPTSGGLPIMLERYRSFDAQTIRDDMGPPIYLVHKEFSTSRTWEKIPARDMIHLRWPILRRGFLAENTRHHFAIPPVTLLARAFITGILQDEYVNDRYKQPIKSAAAIIYNSERTPAIDQDQYEKIRKAIVERLTNSPITTAFDATVTELSEAPVHEQVLAAQNRQMEEVVRIYGIPLPLLSVPLGQWTRGINEQIMKLAWRNCFNLHIDRMLMPYKTRLLRPNEVFHVDPTELVRGDGSAIAELINAMQGSAQANPVASRRELRHLAGLPRQVDGEIINTVTPETNMNNDGGEDNQSMQRPPTRGTPMAELIKLAK